MGFNKKIDKLMKSFAVNPADDFIYVLKPDYSSLEDDKESIIEKIMQNSKNDAVELLKIKNAYEKSILRKS